MRGYRRERLGLATPWHGLPAHAASARCRCHKAHRQNARGTHGRDGRATAVNIASMLWRIKPNSPARPPQELSRLPLCGIPAGD